jgi:hypothetical protein
MNDTNYLCDLTALTPEERKRYQEFEALLPGKIQSISEEPDGYALSFPMTPTNFTLVAEFITYESRCCPFLSFSLIANSGQDLGVLKITGPQDAKPFLQAELGLV